MLRKTRSSSNIVAEAGERREGYGRKPGLYITTLVRLFTDSFFSTAFNDPISLHLRQKLPESARTPEESLNDTISRSTAACSLAFFDVSSLPWMSPRLLFKELLSREEQYLVTRPWSSASHCCRLPVGGFPVAWVSLCNRSGDGREGRRGRGGREAGGHDLHELLLSPHHLYYCSNFLFVEV